MENTTQKQEALALINRFAEIAHDNGFTDGLDEVPGTTLLLDLGRSSLG